MPALPAEEHLDIVDAVCFRIFHERTRCGAYEIAEEIMDAEGLPMHCPYHHYLTAAALLTSAVMNEGGDEEKLKKLLKKARERAGTLPGGICGQYGCCGAAVSAGLFAAVWQGTSPTSKAGWAAGNEMTARALASISTVDGPRCCKRVTYLTLRAAVPAAKELLGVDAGEVPEIVCRRYMNNRECLHRACPFFPKAKENVKEK